MKSVLIVTPYFAPQSHAAVFRAHKLAKYLPHHGWKPYVLTVDTNYLYNEDPGLQDELPEEVEIVRARYIEPTIRGARMALGGRDLTFAAMKSHLLASSSGSSAKSGVPPRRSTSRAFGSGIYRLVLDQWLRSPDAYWSWRRPALRAARNVIERHHIDLLYTTSMPFTSLVIGRTLQRETGVKWVADFRDPAGYGQKFTSHRGHVRDLQQTIVAHSLQNADAVTALSSSYALIFQDLYGDVTKRPIQFIPTGVDDALIPVREDAATAEPYLIYVGEIMPEQTDDFFAIVATALGRIEKRLRLKVVGHELLNRSRLGPIVSAFGISDCVDYIDHLPQRELYRLIRGAAAGILVPGRTAYWWNNHAKLVDYVGLRKPVLAIVPDPSEARSELMRANLGVFLDGDMEQATETLVEFLNGDLPSPEPVASVCDRYLANSQVASFVEVFDQLVGEP